VPAGPTSPTISGSYAFTQLMAMKNQLTPEQQTVLRELLDATHSTLPANAPALPQFQPPQPTLRPAAYYVADDEDQQKAAKLALLQQIYDWANTQVEALTGQPKIPKFKFAIKEFNEPDTIKAWALSTYWADGQKLDAGPGCSMAREGKDRVSVTLDTSSGAGVPVLRINGTITKDDFVSVNAGSVRRIFATMAPATSSNCSIAHASASACLRGNG